jgi:FixJ family two-component response regulator
MESTEQAMQASRNRLDVMSASSMPFVFVLDDGSRVVDELSSFILSGGWQPRFPATTDELLAAAPDAIVGCAILTIDLAQMSDAELTKLVRARPELPIIFMSRQVNIPTTVRAMKAGAFDVLSQPLALEQLHGSISSALEHSHTEIARSSRTRALSKNYRSLSRREREVMQLVVAGRLNKQVGAQLGISEITVKAHRGRVMRKMNATSLADLVNMARDLRVDMLTSTISHDPPMLSRDRHQSATPPIHPSMTFATA